MRHLSLLGPVALYAGLIIFLSSLSDPTGGLRFPPGSDKVVHFCEYALLGVLVTRALRGYGVGRRRALGWAVAACALFGFSDEIHQGFTAGRITDPADWLADVLGATAGSMLWAAGGRGHRGRA